VSPPLFLVDELPAGDTYRLDGSEGHHAADVQRLRAGEELVLADGRGSFAGARVLAVAKGALDVHLEKRRSWPEPDPSVTVVQGIAKGERGELAVQAMTEAGVDAIVPWQAGRSIARWKDDKPLRRWRSTAREAAKQARRPWLPQVTDAVSTAEVAKTLQDFSLVLDEQADRPLSAVEVPATGVITVIVGPEGGISPEELDQFTAAGAIPVRMGSTIMRTSTAGVAAVAALSIRLGRW
jgi:16S rRNA (uracil1498-N3)-methyltransferase